MASLGQKLAEARNRKGISIREASDTTKIRGDYLTKFENDDFDVNLPPVYLRGFLSNYASYLDLDPEGILVDFDGQQPAEKRRRQKGFGTITVDNTEGESQSGESTTPPPQPKGVPSFPWLSVCITLGSLLAVTILVVMIVSFWSDDEPDPNSQTSGRVVEPGVEKVPPGTAIGENNVHQLKLIATGPIGKVFIRLDGQATQIFDDLKPGDVHIFEFKEFFKGGASLRENLMVEIDGVKEANEETGVKIFYGPPKE